MKDQKDQKDQKTQELFDGIDTKLIPQYYQYKETKNLDKIISEFYEIHNTSPFIKISIKEKDGEITGEVDLEMEQGFEEVVFKTFDDPSKVLGDYLSAVMLVISES